MKNRGKPDEATLDEIERKLDKIEKLWKMPEEDKKAVLRIAGYIADATVDRSGDELNRIIKKVRKLGPNLDNEMDVLQIEAHSLTPREAEGIREELNELSTGKRLLTVEKEMKSLRPDLRKYVSDLLAMRVFPIYVKKPYLAVRLTTPAKYKGKISKPKENPVYQLDNYLLEKVGSHLGHALFVVPAFSLEHELAKYGHVVAVTPSEKYLPKPSKKVIPVKKKAQELSAEEIEELKRKTGNNKVVLVIKGINNILNKEEMKELIEKVNPDAIAIYGTWHGSRPNFEGVPQIDKETIGLIEKNYEDATNEIFKENELKRIERLEGRIRSLMEPWAKYFPATRVRVYRRKRL